MKQRGSLLIGMGITVAILTASLAGMGWLYNGALKEKARVQGEYEAFKLVTKRISDKAQKDKEIQEAADKERKEKANVENTVARKRISDLNRQLRDARTKIGALGSPVPRASPDSERPKIASFKRDELERALSEFVDETSGIAEEGDNYRVDLDTAK